MYLTKNIAHMLFVIYPLEKKLTLLLMNEPVNYHRIYCGFTKAAFPGFYRLSVYIVTGLFFFTIMRNSVQG